MLAGAAVLLFVAGEFWYWSVRQSQIRNDTDTQPSIQPAVKRELGQHESNKRRFALIKTFNLIYDSVSSLAISPDSKTILTNSVLGTKLWSLVTKQEISVFDAHNGKVNVVAIDPVGTKFVTGSEDTTIKIWNLATGQEIRTLQKHQKGIHALAISPDGKLLASGGDDNSVRLWNLNTGEELVSFYNHNQRISSLAFDSEGKMLVSASFDGTVIIWDAKAQKLLRTLDSSYSKVYFTNFIKKPGSTSNNSVIASYNSDIRMWNPITGDKIRSFRGHSQPITSTAISSQRNLLASGSSDRTIKLWNLDTGELLTTLKGHSGKVESLAFNRDGNILISAAQDRTIKVWQILDF